MELAKLTDYLPASHQVAAVGVTTHSSKVVLQLSKYLKI